MKNIFITSAALLDMDFEGGFGWIVFVLFICCILVTIFIVSTVYNRVIMPQRLNKANYIMPNYCKALEEIDALKEENTKLKEELNQYKNS